MPAETENIEQKTKAPPPKKKSFIGRLFKWLFIFAGLIILLIIGVFIFIQTDTFDRLALNYALEKINTSLAEKQSVMFAESLEGNLLKGFILKNGGVKVKDDTLLKFTSIEADYDILALLDKEISVQNLRLKEPQINITNLKDKNDSLIWNLDYLLQSDEPPDTSTSEFDWGIIADNVNIENGSVRILENKNSTLPIREIQMPFLDTFDLGKFDLSNLNLDLGAKYFPDNKSVDLRNLSFKTNSDLNVDTLTLKAAIDVKDTITTVNDLVLRTNRSDIEIRELRMSDFNPFTGEDYEHFNDNDTKLKMSSKEFNIKDLTFFLPQLNFLDSTASIELDAEGNYGNLNITKLSVGLPNSGLSFTGNVKNLNKPSQLYFDVTGRDLEIDPADTKRNLPGIPVPDYSYLGKVYIPYVTYKGEPTKFSSDFDVRSSAGNASGNVYFDFTQNVSRYRGDVKTSGLDIGKIVKDRELESNINGEFKVDAAGFDYRTMTGKLNYSINSTRFYGQNISRSDGQLNFNRGNVNLEIDLASDMGRLKTAGSINISNLNNISYDLKGTTSGLNIGSFTKDNSLASDLNFDFDVKGSGIDPNSLNGNFKINMNPSSFAEYKIPAGPLDLEVDQSGNIRKISMKSDFADLTAEGSMNYSSLLTVITANIDKLQSEFSKKLYYDSLNIVPVNTTGVYGCSGLDLKYSINIKDLEPLYSFTGIDSFDVKGYLEGNITDSCGTTYLTSSGILSELRIKDSLFIGDSLKISVDVRNNLNAPGLSDFSAVADLATNRMIVSGFGLDTTRFNVNFSNNINKLTLWTMQDSTMKVFTEGSLRDSLILNLDTLVFRYNNIDVTNNKDLIVQYRMLDTNQHIIFRQFTVNSFNQRLNVAGDYSMNDSSDVKVSASNIDLIAIQKFFNPDIDTANTIAGKVRYFDVEYKGTPAYPDIKLTAVTEQLNVGNTQIGRLDADVVYHQFELKPNITFSNKSNTGKFTLRGMVPTFITFSDEELDSIDKQNLIGTREADLVAVADNFQLKVFQQMIPYTSGLEGILNGKLSLTGTSEEPRLSGNMNIDKGRFYVTLTKMAYNYNAALTTKDEKLLINNSKIYIPEETSRFITTTGYIDFTGFTMNEINLSMTGDVKAFDKDNGSTELGIEGDLWVGSGRQRLNLVGVPGRFDLRGNLVLVRGNVTFNPFIQEAYNVYSDDFVYGVIIDSAETMIVPPKLVIDSLGQIHDSSKSANDSIIAGIDPEKTRIDSTKGENLVRMTLMQNPDSIVVIKNMNLNPFEKIIYIYNHKGLKKVAAEKEGQFFYNVLVTTSENVFLKFIVNEKSQQEFFGEIRTDDLRIYNDVNNEMEGRGTITLGDNCYYRFFRRFDASGKVTFTGPIRNPELDITAQYKGYATSGRSPAGAENLEDVVIDMKVTGGAENPRLAISLTRGTGKETGANATSDAISFLLFGKFQDQLSFGESTALGANLGASFLSSYLSSSIEDIAPWIINTSFNYVDSKTGTVAQNTDIRFTAAIGDAIVRFGGQIFRGIANTDIVLDYPLNKLLEIKSLSNNLIFRFERVYDPFYSDSDITNTNGTRVGAMIYYKIKF